MYYSAFCIMWFFFGILALITPHIVIVSYKNKSVLLPYPENTDSFVVLIDRFEKSAEVIRQ